MMKPFVILFLLLSFRSSFAEISDVEVTCYNLKGDVIHNSYFRIEKDSLKVFETTGGFGFYGRPLKVKTEPSGILRLVQVPCGADLAPLSEISLLTCASGSQVRFLDQILPSVKNGCR